MVDSADSYKFGEISAEFKRFFEDTRAQRKPVLLYPLILSELWFFQKIIIVIV